MISFLSTDINKRFDHVNNVSRYFYEFLKQDDKECSKIGLLCVSNFREHHVSMDR